MPQWISGCGMGIYEEQTRVSCRGSLTIYQAVAGQGWGAGDTSHRGKKMGGHLPKPLPAYTMVRGSLLTRGAVKGRKANREKKRVSHCR